MKLLHLADLHIGKRVNEFSMLEDQRFILERILKIAEEQKPDAVLLAGDLYDRSVPVGEAVGLLDDFLTELAGRGMKVLAVSGNHDSPERLNFGSRLMRGAGVSIAGTFAGRPVEVLLSDSFGPVHMHLLPFLRPAVAAPFFGETQIDSYDAAVRAAVGAAGPFRENERYVLLAHQFVTGAGMEPLRCDSETVSVGGVDNVDVSAFSPYDYVALGHLHGAQQIGRPEVRYAGSPLKYSFSEARQVKSVTLAELGEKGKVEISKIPLSPLRDMREIRGPIAELVSRAVSEQGNPQDYIRAVLTDLEQIPDTAGKLRAVYPNLMRVDFESRSWNAEGTSDSGETETAQSPEQLFEDFYRGQNGLSMVEEERESLADILREAEKEADA